MSLNTNALLTVAEFQTYLGRSDVLAGPQRAQFESYINNASAYIELETGRTLLSGSTETDIFDGQGIPHVDMLHTVFTTTQAPLIENPTPKLYIRASASWSLVNQDTWTWDTTNGSIYFTDGSYFVEGRSNYRAVYDYGYSGSASVPFDLKLACNLLAHRYSLLSSHQGTVSTSTGDRDKTYNFDKLPRDITIILESYKR